MPFLTKPVRNLLLAAMFGIALVLVEPGRAQASYYYPMCIVPFMNCVANNGSPGADAEGAFCFEHAIVYPYDCFSNSTGLLIDEGFCYGADPYGNPEYCGD